MDTKQKVIHSLELRNEGDYLNAYLKSSDVAEHDILLGSLHGGVASGYPDEYDNFKETMSRVVHKLMRQVTGKDIQIGEWTKAEAEKVGAA